MLYPFFLGSVYSFRERFDLLNSKVLTKIQAILLVAIIVAAVVAGAAYVLSGGQEESSETIKIGILTDIAGSGKGIWQQAGSGYLPYSKCVVPFLLHFHGAGYC
jgi:hypothetical protein